MPRGGLKRTATSLSIDTELSEKRKSAEYHSASNAFEAEREERQARDRFLSAGASTKDEEEESSRRLEHIEKLVLEVTEATVHAPRRNSLVAAATDKLEPPPRRDSNALATAVSSASPPLRRSLLLPIGGRAEGMTPFHAKLDTLSQQVQSQGQQLQQALDALGQLTRGLAAGSSRADSARATLAESVEVIGGQAAENQQQMIKQQERPTNDIPTAWRPPPPPPNTDTYTDILSA